MKSKRLFFANGFTLIELMITVAIVGILAAVAYPSYTSQIARGKRADARVQLVSAQQWMEKFFSENYSYTTDSTGVAGTAAAAFNAQPFSRSPRVGDGNAVYTVTVTPTITAYTLTATPIAGGTMAADTCGTFTLTSTGRRGATGDVLTCWK